MFLALVGSPRIYCSGQNVSPLGVNWGRTVAGPRLFSLNLSLCVDMTTDEAEKRLKIQKNYTRISAY